MAARLIRRSTRVGLYPVGEGSQTRAFRSNNVSYPVKSPGFSEYTLRTGYDSSTAERNIDAGDKLVVAFQLILELESAAFPAIEFDSGISGNS